VKFLAVKLTEKGEGGGGGGGGVASLAGVWGGVSELVMDLGVFTNVGRFSLFQ